MRSGSGPITIARSVLLRVFSNPSEIQSAPMPAPSGKHVAPESLETSELEVGPWMALPSLRDEIATGQQPPYEFAATLGRCAINHFSKIYGDNDVERFVGIVNEFYIEAACVIARYHGRIYELRGDELLFYVKDEEVGVSTPFVLSAMRDLNAVAAEFSKRTMERHGYPFTIKSTFSQGRLRFGQFLNQYALTGAPIVETSRILAQAAEKDGNIIVFEQRHEEYLDQVAYVVPYTSIRIKGINEEKHMMVYDRHFDLRRFLISDEPREIENLRQFRAEAHIETLLDWLRHEVRESNSRVAFKVMGILREIPLLPTAVSERIPNKLFNWLEAMSQPKQGAPEAEQDLRTRMFGAGIRLIENLVPKDKFDSRFQNLLKHAIDGRDRRVIANALDVLTAFQSTSNVDVCERFARHPDNRVAASALMHEGLRGISPFVIKRLHKMLSSRNAGTMSSALYALGEIARYHRQRDPAYYASSHEFLHLVDWIPALAVHDEPMVRRQALAAARKCADEAQLLKIMSAVEDRGDALRADEARAQLGDLIPGRKAA